MASADLVPIYYLTGIGTAIGSGLIAARTYFARQRSKWISEGSKEASLAEKIEANTAAAVKNTQAIESLSSDMRTFVARTEQRLNGHDAALGRLENIVLSGKDWRSGS